MESTTLSRKRSYIETAAIFPSCVYKRDTSHIVPRSTLQKSFWQDNLVLKAKIVINKLAECWLLVHGKQTCVESHSYVPKKLEFFYSDWNLEMWLIFSADMRWKGHVQKRNVFPPNSISAHSTAAIPDTDMENFSMHWKSCFVIA